MSELSRGLYQCPNCFGPSSGPGWCTNCLSNFKLSDAYPEWNEPIKTGPFPLQDMVNLTVIFGCYPVKCHHCGIIASGPARHVCWNAIYHWLEYCDDGRTDLFPESERVLQLQEARP